MRGILTCARAAALISVTLAGAVILPLQAFGQQTRPDLTSPLIGTTAPTTTGVPNNGSATGSVPITPTGGSPISVPTSGGASADQQKRVVQVQVLENVGSPTLMGNEPVSEDIQTVKARVLSASGGETSEGSEQTDPVLNQDTRFNGVTLEGGMQVQESQDPGLVQQGIRYQSRIVWDSVTVELPNGDVRRVYLNEALESDIALRTQPTIRSGTTMTAQGNIDELMRVAQEIANDVEENQSGSEDPERTQNNGGAAASPTSLTGESGSKGDSEEVKDIRSPEITAEEPPVDPVVTVTTEGCQVIVDLNNDVVKQTSKTLVDGVVQGGCVENGTVFAIKKTANSCPVQEVIDARKAYPTYTKYYTDGNGSRQTVSDGCERGEDTDFYAIIERADKCTLEENKADLAVFERVELVYNTPQGQSVIVRGCERSTSTPIAVMEYTEDGCGTSTHAVTGAITQLQRLHYVLNGADETVVACAATPTSVVWVYQTTGCPVSVDLAAGVVRVMHRLFEDETPIGECQAEGTSFPIQRDSIGCPVEVDLAELKAFPTFNTFYVGSDQVRTSISESCARGTAEDYFVMYRDTSVCTPYLDLTAREVFEQSATLYRKPQGDVVTVLSCALGTPAVKVADIDVSTSGCTLHDDFDGSISTQRTKLVYLLEDGIERQASSCQVRDDSPSYQQSTIICGEEADKLAGTHAFRTKVQIEVDGLPVDRTACMVDDTTAVGMSKVTETCRSLFAHDIPGNRSFGYSRYRFERNGVVNYATSCEADTEITFEHLISDPLGWALNDPDKSALAQREIYFQAYDQRILVQSASVLQSEAPQAYSFGGISMVDGTPVYNGCTKTTPQLESAAYTRPDTTVLYELTGLENPPIIANACSQVIQTPRWEDQNKEYLRSCYTWEQSNPTGNKWITTCTSTLRGTYRGSRQLSRDDGETISQTSASTHQESWSASKSAAWANPGYPPYPEGSYQATYTGPNMTSWNQAEGW